MENIIGSVPIEITRLGVVAQPNGDPEEREGILNPATARARDGKLLLYPRMVAEGNTSKIGIFEKNDDFTFHKVGIALRPEASYEIRDVPGGYGCEDPRITYIPLLDLYIMAYTAYGPCGARIALATSEDGYAWKRLGLMNFSATKLPDVDDKDAAFFPEPVSAPSGTKSFAFYHRPMLSEHNEWTHIGYIPVENVLENINELLCVKESVVVLDNDNTWGKIKNGAGTPPIRIREGWLSVFHGVDGIFDESGVLQSKCYSAGIVIHDAQRPDIVLYRSPIPVLTPQTTDEISGIMHNVVFPTGIDTQENERDLDIYYGMADERIGRLRLSLGETTLTKLAA